MVESYHSQQDKPTDVSAVGRLTAPIRNLCWRLAICFKFEAIIEAQWSENIIDQNRPDMQHLRRQIRQLTNASKCIALYLFILSIVYVLMSLYTCMTISDFSGKGFSADYTAQLYAYARDIEIMKLVQAVLLACICAFIYNLCRQNRVLTRK